MMARLPLVTLYLTERCNSRCVTCDYWRHGRDDVSVDHVRRLLPDFASLGTRSVLISGGEPLLHPEWAAIAALLREQGLQPWLLTSGLSLAKHAARAASAFDSITVSLDGTCAATYAAIRGLDAFDKVCEGVRAAVAAGARVSLRVTLQRSNYRELPAFVALARRLGARQVSFLAVDVGNPHAFARTGASAPGLALDREDLPGFAALIDALIRDEAGAFGDGFIAESPQRLRALVGYFAALLGDGVFPSVRCNAPEFSAVIDTHGRVAPCFFIAGPDGVSADRGLRAALDDEAMTRLRASIRAGRRPECERCVCPKWREPGSAEQGFALPEVAHA
jgi:MoaA/NifB/PqqE/SkfB family radical SAM enzyme